MDKQHEFAVSGAIDYLSARTAEALLSESTDAMYKADANIKLTAGGMNGSLTANENGKQLPPMEIATTLGDGQLSGLSISNSATVQVDDAQGKSLMHEDESASASLWALGGSAVWKFLTYGVSDLTSQASGSAEIKMDDTDTRNSGTCELNLEKMTDTCTLDFTDDKGRKYQERSLVRRNDDLLPVQTETQLLDAQGHLVGHFQINASEGAEDGTYDFTVVGNKAFPLPGQPT